MNILHCCADLFAITVLYIKSHIGYSMVIQSIGMVECTLTGPAFVQCTLRCVVRVVDEFFVY